MPIDFPNSPTNGQTFTVGEKVWIYQDGKWQGGNGPLGPEQHVTISSNAPASPVQGEMWFDSDTTQTFIYYGSVWVEVGTAAAGGPLDSLSDVIITNPANNDVLYYNGSAFVNTSLANIGGAGNAVTTISTSAPASPSAGNLWFESDTGKTYIYYDSYWVEVGAVSTGSRIAISGSAPAGAQEGDLWFNSTTAKTFIYYDSSWVEVGAANSVPSILDDLTDVTITSAAANQILQWNGTAWVNATINALPSQGGNAGKYLTTNGTTASWATVSTDVMTDTKNAALITMDIGA